jgi:hypothetical protein
MVWRRRICKACHTSWLTEERVSEMPAMPEETRTFLDTVMRNKPKHTPSVDGPSLNRYKKEQEKENFGKSGMTKMPW